MVQSKSIYGLLILIVVLISGCVKSSPKAELSVVDTDVSIHTLSNEDRTLNLTILVHNIGELDAHNVLVSAEAKPINEAGGNILIGSFTIPNIPSGSEALAFIVWDTKKTYRHNMINITIDPMNSIEENNKENNFVFFSYSIN